MKPEGLIGYFKRSATQDLVQFFCNGDKKTGLCYLRGRRRVGKSTLLKELAQKKPIFYYSGKLDEPLNVSLERFAKEWSDFSNQEILKKIKTSELNWDLIFDGIILYAKTKKLMLALDEIQWIAKSQNGFIGTLKNKWVEIEKTQNVRLVICGSSNKFFKDYTGGEEQILRGLKTRSDIVLQAFSPTEVYKHYVPHWRAEEVIFIYMLTGGIPYYLNQMPKKKNFIQTMNQTFFTNQSIFREEVDEILRLEFNQAGLLTIKKILAGLGLRGRSLAEIQKKTKIAVGTLTEAIEKLTEYKILFEKKPVFSKSLEIKRGLKFVMKDFYLNFYFKIIKPNSNQIKLNDKNDLLVNSIFNWPQSFYYVEGFTGEAFENFIENILVGQIQRKEKIFKKLELDHINFEVGTHWDQNSQIDLVIYDCDDQQIRLLECKWTSSIALIKEAIINLVEKTKKMNFENKPLLAVAVPIKPTAALFDFSRKNRVVLIGQQDLFELR